MKYGENPKNATDRSEALLRTSVPISAITVDEGKGGDVIAGGSLPSFVVKETWVVSERVTRELLVMGRSVKT